MRYVSGAYYHYGNIFGGRITFLPFPWRKAAYKLRLWIDYTLLVVRNFQVQSRYPVQKTQR